MELAVDLLHVLPSPLQLISNGWSSVLVFINLCQNLMGEALSECKNGHYTQREDVDCHVVSGLVSQCLWGHVDRRTRYFGHGGYPQAGDDTSHPKVCDLGCHGGVQENISCRKVPMDQRRRTAVQVAETLSDVVEERVLEPQGDIGPSLQQVVEAGQQSLHHQRREPRARQHADAEKEDDVWVAKGAHESALLKELACRPLHLILRYFGAVLEDVVDLLDGAYRSRYLPLLHATVGS